MMATWGETWKQQWLAEGRAEGYAEVFIRFAEKRFGPLSAEQRTCIQAADMTTIDVWVDRLMEAPSLEALFLPPS